ncbi:MAG: hypothetical protein EBT92_13805 [Planctomycetes bacterium]|nr:hypothetical protein [Planctomycetota bacterium]
MRRRRRPDKEIHFSFDSFLDVVANVVGIIIKLILVAWVGARTYKGFEIPESFTPNTSIITENKLADVSDPLVQRIIDKSKMKADVEAILTSKKNILNEQNKEKNLNQQKAYVLNGSLEALIDQEKKIKALIDESSEINKNSPQTIAKIKTKSEQLEEEIENLKKTKGAKNELKYKTPVSRTLQSEEMIFECKNGRITPVDIGAMLEEVSGRMQSLGEKLRKQWELEEVSQNYGPFKIRFTLERERSGLEIASLNAIPDERANFRFSLTGWVLESLDPERGETLEQALDPNSEFMKIINSLDQNQTAVTFCVYPDSFTIYRRMRDLLHEKNIVVAGRPLNFDAPIAMSVKKGTASRGQ